MSTPILSVDIGNTNTHTGLIDRDALACRGSDVFPTTDLSGRLCPSLASLVPKGAQTQTLPVIICSVVKVDPAAIADALVASDFRAPVWFEYSGTFPISVAYNDPRTLGVDRLADCLYSCAAYPEQSRIIIDAGTTITVDYLANGREFSGGAILPGIATQFKSLHEHTSALPPVNLDESATEFPGRSTKSAMTTGVIYGSAGALSFLVARYKEQFGSDAMVLATGGAWKQVGGLVTFKFEYVKDLTLIGTGLFGTAV
jgi:type III pantothenate kinase